MVTQVKEGAMNMKIYNTTLLLILIITLVTSWATSGNMFYTDNDTVTFQYEDNVSNIENTFMLPDSERLDYIAVGEDNYGRFMVRTNNTAFTPITQFDKYTITGLLKLYYYATFMDIEKCRTEWLKIYYSIERNHK